MSSSYLISRLNGLNLQKEDINSVDDVFAALEVATQLAEDAVAEVVATELAIDKLLESTPSPDFFGK